MPTRIPAAVTGALLLCAATVVLATGEGGKAPDSPPLLRLEVTIDGEAFDVEEGRERVIRSGDRDLAVTVRRKPVQPYATAGLVFDHGLGFSLKDDRAEENRTVTLVHASGASLVITEFGDVTEEQLVMTLAAIVAYRKRAIERENPVRIEASKAKRAKLPHGEGFEATLRHTDADGDTWVCRVLVLASGGRAFSLIHNYEAGEAAAAERLAKPTFESIRAR